MAEKEQYEAKAAVTGDLGERLEAALVAAGNEVLRLAGASSGLKHGADIVLRLHAHIRADLDAGRIHEKMSAVEVAEVAMRWISRASEALLNASEKAKLDEVGVHGKVVGLRHAIELTQRMHNTAVARVAQEVAADAEVEGGQPVATGMASRKPSRLDGRRQDARKKKVGK